MRIGFVAALVLQSVHLSDGDWWSLQPVVRPALLAMERDDQGQARTTIDVFIVSKLREKGLAMSPEADRRTLIRRLYFDLLGLPPSPSEVDTFLQDTLPLAYERMVDQLLASPHYGERWARHWLDVVHYGDTHGYDKDKPRPNAWPYRDYVIRSLNDDKPYARFVQEQIAGDALWPDQPDGIVATGFIAAGPWDFIGHAEVPETKIDGRIARNLDRDDMVGTTMNTFVSITVQCARCHDHKFDPVTQKHYYSLQAVFSALDRADRGYDESPALARRRRELNQQKAELDKRKQAIEARIAKAAGIEPAGDPELVQVCAMLDAVSQELASLPAQLLVYAGTVHHGSGSFQGTGHTGGKPREIRILVRGDVNQSGELVAPGTMPIIPGVDSQFVLPADPTEGDRRVALATWLVHRDNPLTWRSIVNRLWLYHFGRGLVDTPNDFGRMGELPTHPELLDWLAAELRDGDGSLKRLHKLVVTSSVYRQSSADHDAGATLDTENKYYWRMNRRALDAEAIRDAVLAVSGKLDRTMYGPGFQDFVLELPEHSPHYEYHKHDPDNPASHRRSVYRFVVRSQPQPFMETLDCADPSQSVAKRDTTLTSLQALALLNNPLMVRMAEHFSRRVQSMEGSLAGQVEAAFRLALGRPPRDQEKAQLVAFADRFGLANTCRAILNLNEFVFVD